MICYFLNGEISGIIESPFDQVLKEKVYINLLLSILKTIDEKDIVIIYDWFKNKTFENSIERSILATKNFLDVKAGDSQLYHGLQYIDNICSSIRLRESGMYDIFYDIIVDKITRIDTFDLNIIKCDNINREM